MKAPRLSICIPTFKREGPLRETLAHLLEVCGQDVEIVISDNCSPDGTPDVINSFAGRFRHFRAVRQAENRGAIRNFAAAMALARGRYLYPLSDDDRVHVQGLQNAISIMEQDPTIGAVFGGYEEWILSTGEIFPHRPVEQKMDFAQGDKVSVLNKFVLLWHPVCRTDIVHRYCSFETRTFGMWELVGSIMERSNVSVIPDLFYRHAHTEPRLEYELTEGWYHDAYRAGFETFIGRMGELGPEKLGVFVAGRASPAFLTAVHFAEIKRDFLAARHFILRARAYGLISAADVMSWEVRNLVGMVAERLLAKVELIPAIDEIVFDASPRLQALRERFGAIAQKYSILDMSDAKILQGGFQPNQFLVTYSCGSYDSGAPAECDPTLSAAAEDLIETCRVTDQSLAFDTAGAAGPK